MSEISTPTPLAYTTSFLLVAVCWGFTTPFIRRAALTYTAPSPSTHPSLSESRSWLARKAALAFWTLLSLLSKPSYAIPLVANLTGSIWFFLLVGQAGKLIHIDTRRNTLLMLLVPLEKSDSTD